MSALTARIVERLDHDAIVAARRRNWAELARRLGRLAPPVVEELGPGVCPLFYPFITEAQAGLMARLAARGIETVDFWSVGHPACPAGAFPEVERLRRTVLELPLHQDLTLDDVAYLARSVEEAHA
jgi:dTDP-4-amino-4,6-dideoxygalactose transaminase